MPTLLTDRTVPLVHAATRAGVRDVALLRAIRDVPRELFVPAALSDCAVIDAPIPIPHQQTTSQPSLIALMVEALQLVPEEVVLEVGTGYGYQTALLAHLVRHVYSVEWWADLAEAARGNLALADVHNVTVSVGDGGEGLPEFAPYDGIVVTAATTSVPRPLVDQLAEGGRLVQPVGRGGREQVRLFRRSGDRLVSVRVVSPARFVPLVGRFAPRRGRQP